MPLDSYSKLISLLSAPVRQGWSSPFVTAQLESAEQHFRALIPYVRSGHVKSIVDVGCGNGAVLKSLAERISEDFIQHPSNQDRTQRVILTGIDPSLVDSMVEISVGECVSLRLLRCLAEDFRFPPEPTAGLVLGHTIFQLVKSAEELGRFLQNAGAVLWLVDIHRDWDNVVTALPQAGTVDEPSVLNTPGVVLRTARRGEEPIVTRGHYDTVSSTWEFATTQLFIGTKKVDVIFEKLGYRVLGRYGHESGWGAVVTTAYAC